MSGPNFSAFRSDFAHRGLTPRDVSRSAGVLRRNANRGGRELWMLGLAQRPAPAGALQTRKYRARRRRNR